ncbi:hypothetical protein RHMOL_Rhmol06G0015400 [Rhododendron molle]|uniref:Uncharacterized protein n=1 Tax=Rhododendron molle TaxID=49168 RepID=A0ACC0N8U3_RHOML|nr:hypothetical protein RHMOL_Rhmol06G0015400 [Rhododendron molle]
MFGRFGYPSVALLGGTGLVPNGLGFIKRLLWCDSLSQAAVAAGCSSGSGLDGGGCVRAPVWRRWRFVLV